MKIFKMIHSNEPFAHSPAAGRRKSAAGSARKRLVNLLLATALVGSPAALLAAGPAPVDLRSTAPFTILAGAAITSTGGGAINGDVGASPIAGSAIGVTCAQVNGIIYAVDASGPPCAVIDSVLLTTAKGDLTTAYNDAAGRTPVPSGPNLNPGLIPGSGNIGGMSLAPGLYKFTTTALITGSDVTLTGGPNDVWIFQCSQDLQLGSGIKVILAGGARANNVFWQVGTSAVLGTFSVFQGTILADQAITINTSATLVGRALAFSAGVTFNGTSSSLPASAPLIGVQQPAGVNLTNGVNTNYFGSVIIGTNSSLTFIVTNLGTADLTGLGITIDGADAASFSVTTNPVAPVGPGSNTTFTVRFAPLTTGLKAAVLHIASNDSTNNPFDLNLTGNGATVSAPLIGVQQPAGINLTNGINTNYFGLVVVGTNSSLTFIVTNFGTADLTLSSLTIDGADATSFSVTTNPVSPVSPAGSTTFTVRFAPLTTGLKVAVLHIASNDSTNNPFDLNLTGNGATVSAPLIGVQQAAGINLTNGVNTNYFGSVIAGANSSLTFIVTNFGTADLTLSSLTIDGADATSFSVSTNPVSPITPAGSTTFTVRFAPLTTGLKVAVLHIASNDSTNNPFDLNLTGNGATVLAPLIGVQQPVGINLTNGLNTNYFGSVIAGTNSSLTFIVTNFGTADLTLSSLTIDGADATSFSVTANPVSPVSPAGSTTFTVRFAPLTAGPKAAALHIANNDFTASPFNLNLTGNGTNAGFVVATNVYVFAASPIKLNPQTGLFEQTVRLTNSNPVTVTGIRLLIFTLPSDVQVYNASGTTNGSPFVQYGLPLASGGTVDLLIEYYRANRQAIPQPAFVVQFIAPVAATASGTIIAVDRSVQLQSGRFLIEFSAIQGNRYAVQYSSDTVHWKTANPIITAPSNRVQWYDDGPPKTDSKPTALGSRFYRVVSLP